jgi:hypothetical protein
LELYESAVSCRSSVSSENDRPAADMLATKEGRGNFGFGTIRLRQGLMQSIRVQVNDVQIYWLADMTDPEVWDAIDKWREGKRALVRFNVRGQRGESGTRYFSSQEFHKAHTATNNSGMSGLLQRSIFGPVWQSWLRVGFLSNKRNPTLKEFPCAEYS